MRLYCCVILMWLASFILLQLPVSALAAASIPVVHHVSRDSQGQEAVVSEQTIAEAMQRLNQAFAGSGLFFFSMEIRYIDRDDWYQGWDSDSYWQSLDELTVSNALNVFHLNSLSGNGRANFPFRQRDYVFVRASRLPYTTLIHEVGHYFGLLHTFSSSRFGAFCWNSGDLLCDTPYDPVESRRDFDPQSCEYIGKEPLDPVPDGRNFMSRGRSECRTHFSPEQISRMQHTLINDRFYLGHQVGGVYQQKMPTLTALPLYESFEPAPWQQFSWLNDVVTDDANWTVAPSTGTRRSGPQHGAADGRHFIYLNGSVGAGAVAHLLSPWFRLDSENKVEFCFSYHMHGATMGQLQLQQRQPGTDWHTLWQMAGEQHQADSPWSQSCIQLEATAAFQLRFRGQVGSGRHSHMALDQLRLQTIRVLQ